MVDSSTLDVANPNAVLVGAPYTGRSTAGHGRDRGGAPYRLLWDMNRWLIKRPMSLSQIVERVKSEVAERANTPEAHISTEVESALVIGAALPEEVVGTLRLRSHRFVRGGWMFHRCINPACHKIFPRGEEHCRDCHHQTAPLYLCRNCGADYLRVVGELDEGHDTLRPSAIEGDGPEWMIYQPDRFQANFDEEDDEEVQEEAPPRRRRASQAAQEIRGRQILTGSLDPGTLRFSRDPGYYSVQVTLVPARSRCLCCGKTGGSHNVISPVSLGTSAAVKVLGEGLVEALAEVNRDTAEPRRQGAPADLQR